MTFFEYKLIFNFYLVCVFISLFLFSLSFFLILRHPDVEKLSPYECGFNPYGDARSKFEVKFILVGILFIIFDLELMFIFPWVLFLHDIYPVGIIVMHIFIFILLIGFIMNCLKEQLIGLFNFLWLWLQNERIII